MEIAVSLLWKWQRVAIWLFKKKKKKKTILGNPVKEKQTEMVEKGRQFSKM